LYEGAGRRLISVAIAIMASINCSVMRFLSLTTSVSCAPYARIVRRFSSLNASENTKCAL